MGFKNFIDFKDFANFMDSIIEVKNLGKKYKIGEGQSYLALRDTLTNIAKSPLGWFKGKTRQEADKKNDFWALKDVNFKVEKGEVLGIIGRNGAGKSTLLKILSQITPPTTGEIRLRGRVGSLLEVGTGFHPELTGRENIFLNGAILGMRKKEIERKLSEIIEFAGIEKFIDTPVKRYSSGMYVRLAFSVAAHLEPDILIIDEVLAVGDIGFQKKCLDRMEKITNTEGRTILFVSHNIPAVKSLCSKTIWLDKSTIRAWEDTNKVVEEYVKDMEGSSSKSVVELPVNKNKEISFLKLWVTDQNNHIVETIGTDTEIKILVKFFVNNPINTADINISLVNSKGVVITVLYLSDFNQGKLIPFEKGVYTASASIKPGFLVPDYYGLRIFAYIGGVKNIDFSEEEVGFRVEHISSVRSVLGCVFGEAKWDIQKDK